MLRNNHLVPVFFKPLSFPHSCSFNYFYYFSILAYQFGFLPFKSTTTTLLSYLQSFSTVCGAFLDVKKGLNSVSISPLSSSYFKIFPSLINWIHSYLINCSQSVILNSHCSPPVLVSSGVPQGSILDPLLFLIYVNEALELILFPQSNIILYADDIFVFKPLSSPSDLPPLSNRFHPHPFINLH